MESLQRAEARGREILIHRHYMAGLSTTHSESRASKVPVEYLQEGLTR